MDRPLRFAAQLQNVREVTLHGSASAEYWRPRLAAEQLHPVIQDGRVRVLIISAEARFRGVAFRELSISILVSKTESGHEEQGALLVAAFNSRRFFALVERLWFATPYRHADVRLCATLPAFTQLSWRGQPVLVARMNPDASSARIPVSDQDEGWEGPVFLPARGRRKGRVFYAIVRGTTQTYVFDPHVDRFEIRPCEIFPVFTQLCESDFTVHQWALRLDAVHAKSPTYSEGNVPQAAARRVVAVEGAT